MNAWKHPSVVLLIRSSHGLLIMSTKYIMYINRYANIIAGGGRSVSSGAVGHQHDMEDSRQPTHAHDGGPPHPIAIRMLCMGVWRIVCHGGMDDGVCSGVVVVSGVVDACW